MSINVDKQNGKPTIHIKLGIWTVVAATISYMANHSIWWALFHGLCGIYYVAYFCIRNWDRILYTLTWFVHQCVMAFHYIQY